MKKRKGSLGNLGCILRLGDSVMCICVSVSEQRRRGKKEKRGKEEKGRERRGRKGKRGGRRKGGGVQIRRTRYSRIGRFGIGNLGLRFRGLENNFFLFLVS